ncbi:hypothetical protein CBL_03264 [Carabus blaptoides fortunei]
MIVNDRYDSRNPNTDTIDITRWFTNRPDNSIGGRLRPVNPVATRAVCMPGVTPEYSGLVHSHTHTLRTYDGDVSVDDRLSPLLTRSPLRCGSLTPGYRLPVVTQD